MKTDPTLYDIAKNLVITSNAFEAKRAKLDDTPTEFWPKWAKEDLETAIDALWHGYQIGRHNAYRDIEDMAKERHGEITARGFQRRPGPRLKR